jgi:predicted N-acyltransferase
MGEFVFDFAFARAYEQHGLHYYPKWVSMTPFTPATVSHLKCAPGVDRSQMLSKLMGALTQLPSSLSSLHALFISDADREVFLSHGFIERIDCQFHWHNEGYTDFETYLQTFSADKRKKTKRERRRIQELGIHCVWQRSDELTYEQWQAVYALKRDTFLRHGHEPYIPLDFFWLLKDAKPDLLWVNGAYRDGELIAAAIFFKDQDTLYGRYWGSHELINSLHFEVCYHQGIEFCITHKLKHFEPGTQGEHKIARGFNPTFTHSAHYFKDERFMHAIADYFAKEREGVIAYADRVRNHLPFKQLSRTEADAMTDVMAELTHLNPVDSSIQSE